MDSQRQKVGWNLWAWWLLATFIGLVVGIVAGIVLSYAVVNQFHPEPTDLIGGFCVGAAVGCAQVLAARRVLSLKWVWVPGVIVGMGVPYTIGVLFDEAWFGPIQLSGMWQIPIVIVSGALAGVIQEGAFAHYTPKAHWWIWISIVTWGITWFISFPLSTQGILVAPLVYGALSGVFLIRLVRTAPTRKVV